jgi:uncharacterized membrane protein
MIPIHPRIVHFPVALLITTAVIGILALVFTSKRRRLMELMTWNLSFGVGGALLAVLSGLLEEKTIVHNDIIHGIMETHKTIGLLLTGVSLLLFSWWILRKSKMRLLEFTSLVIVLVLSVGLLVYGAHLGGRLVYEEGAGILPMEKIISGKEHNHQHENDKSESQEINIVNDSLEQSEFKDSQNSHVHDHSSHEH